MKNRHNVDFTAAVIKITSEPCMCTMCCCPIKVEISFWKGLVSNNLLYLEQVIHLGLFNVFYCHKTPITNRKQYYTRPKRSRYVRQHENAWLPIWITFRTFSSTYSDNGYRAPVEALISCWPDLCRAVCSPTSSQSLSAPFNWALSSMVNNTATATSARTITKSKRKPHVIEPSTTDAPKGKQDEDGCRKADAEKAKALKSLRAGTIGGIDALRSFCCRRRKGTTSKIAKQKKLTKIYDYDRNNNGIEQKWR